MRRAGLFTKIVLLETLISRIRNLSTEDGFPAWRIADVGGWFSFGRFFISWATIYLLVFDVFVNTINQNQ